MLLNRLPHWKPIGHNRNTLQSVITSKILILNCFIHALELRNELVGVKPVVSLFWPMHQNTQFTAGQPGGHPRFVLSFAALLLENREQLGCSIPFQASHAPGRGWSVGFLEYQPHGFLAGAWWSREVLGALLVFGLRLLYPSPQKSERTLIVLKVQALHLLPALFLWLSLEGLKIWGFRSQCLENARTRTRLQVWPTQQPSAAKIQNA